MMPLPVYILAGGKSSRFGSDKARALFRGRPLILHVQQLVMPVASRVTVVADQPDKYADLGMHTIADRHPGRGPLAGLDTALADLQQSDTGRWLLMCSCDAVVIQPHWLARLCDNVVDQADAVAFGEGGRWQPMPALYGQSCAAAVAAQLQTERRSMRALLDGLRVNALPLPDDWPEHWQVNSPAELREHDTTVRRDA